MKSSHNDLKKLFEKAYEVREQVRDGDDRTLAELNKELADKKLGGRLVVLALPEEHLHPSSRGVLHSQLFPGGRLGDFTVKYDDDTSDAELVMAVNDLRGANGRARFVPVVGVQEPYDVAREQADSGLYGHILDLLADPGFTFPDLARLCLDIDQDNLSFALFAAALNGFKLPNRIASKVFTKPCGVYYYTNGKDISPSQGPSIGYSLSGLDMFSFVKPRSKLGIQTRITTMFPTDPMREFRDIFVDEDMVAFDRV